MNKLHRYISFFLCLALILFCLSSPLQRSASADSGLVSLYMGGSVISVSGVVAVAVLVLSGLGIVWGSLQEAVAEAQLWYNAVPKIVKDWLDKAGEEVIEGSTTVKIPSAVIEGINSIDDAYQLSPSSPYLVTSNFNIDALSPSDLFAQDIVGAIQGSGSVTHSLLRNLYGLLNTEFAETFDSIELQTSAISTGFSNVVSNLGSKITSLSTTLSGKLDSLETSVDVMSSSLTKGLTDLKTLYSSFGQATLDKLTVLNTSIEAINGFDWSVDFSHLKSLYTQFGNATLDSLDDLIASTDYVTAAIFSAAEAQSTELFNIYEELTLGFSDLSSKLDGLTVDVAFPNLEWLFDSVSSIDYKLDSLTVDVAFPDFDVQLSELHSISDALTDGFSELSSKLDDLTVDVAFPDLDLQLSELHSISDALTDGFSELSASLVDQVLELYSISDALADGFSDVSLSAESLASLNEVTSYFYESYLALSEMTQMMIDDIYVMLQQPLASMNKNLTNVSASLDSLVTQLQSFETNLHENVTAFLQTDIVGALNDIKTSIKSIAGTTTADPNPGTNNSQNDYEKEKAPLIPWIGNGFEIGGIHFNSVQGFLSDDMEAFLVAGMIFEEFAGISFFNKLIIISCSVGLIGTLLGMALQLQSYSIAQRRREEAAQSRAHVRMERSAAV